MSTGGTGRRKARETAVAPAELGTAQVHQPRGGGAPAWATRGPQATANERGRAGRARLGCLGDQLQPPPPAPNLPREAELWREWEPGPCAPRAPAMTTWSLPRRPCRAVGLLLLGVLSFLILLR